VIAILSRPLRRSWTTMSFSSTLYLVPILDLLLDKVPADWQAELRLGLQEALVNAASHGNGLDPNRQISVRFSIDSRECYWVIADQGAGFSPPLGNQRLSMDHLCDEQECGRGLYILQQVFDQVEWNRKGTELRLYKQIRNAKRAPLFA
jgi:serine/threonine-protein kinase RsbW